MSHAAFVSPLSSSSLTCVFTTATLKSVLSFSESFLRLSSLSSSHGFQRASIISPTFSLILYFRASSSLSGGRYIFTLFIIRLPSPGMTTVLLFVSMSMPRLFTLLGLQLSW